MNIVKIVDDALLLRAKKPVIEKVWTRKRYVGLVNKYTGEVAVIDQFEKRKQLMRLRIVAWAETMKQYRASHETRMVMIGLSYAHDGDYQAGHINLYIKDLKRRLGENLIGFAWVSELTERGRIHYHLVLLVKKGSRIPLPDKSGMWSHGTSSIQTANTPYYLVKYVGKEHQKDLGRYPKSCRLYGVSVRALDVKYRHLYRRLAGLEKPEKPYTAIFKSEGWDKKPESAWRYVGTTHTEGYLRDIVLSDDVIINSTTPY